MRNRFLVCYDVSDSKRLARTYRKMNGFGDPAQYSVFICDLSPKERVLLEEALAEVLNLKEDRALIVDLGPSEGRGQHEPYHPGKGAGSAPPGGGDSMMRRRHTPPRERWDGEAAKLDRSQLPR